MSRLITLSSAVLSAILFLALITTAVLHGVGVEPANPFPLYAGLGFGFATTVVTAIIAENAP